MNTKRTKINYCCHHHFKLFVPTVTVSLFFCLFFIEVTTSIQSLMQRHTVCKRAIKLCGWPPESIEFFSLSYIFTDIELVRKYNDKNGEEDAKNTKIRYDRPYKKNTGWSRYFYKKKIPKIFNFTFSFFFFSQIKLVTNNNMNFKWCKHSMNITISKFLFWIPLSINILLLLLSYRILLNVHTKYLFIKKVNGR